MWMASDEINEGKNYLAMVVMLGKNNKAENGAWAAKQIHER